MPNSKENRIEAGAQWKAVAAAAEKRYEFIRCTETSPFIHPQGGRLFFAPCQPKESGAKWWLPWQGRRRRRKKKGWRGRGGEGERRLPRQPLNTLWGNQVALSPLCKAAAAGRRLSHHDRPVRSLRCSIRRRAWQPRRRKGAGARRRRGWGGRKAIPCHLRCFPAGRSLITIPVPPAPLLSWLPRTAGRGLGAPSACCSSTQASGPFHLFHKPPPPFQPQPGQPLLGGGRGEKREGDDSGRQRGKLSPGHPGVAP